MKTSPAGSAVGRRSNRRRWRESDFFKMVMRELQALICLEKRRRSKEVDGHCHYRRQQNGQQQG